MSDQRITYADPISEVVGENMRRADDIVQRTTYLLMMARQRQARNLAGDVDGNDHVYRTTARTAQEQQLRQRYLKPGDLVSDRSRERVGTVVATSSDDALVRYVGESDPIRELRSDLMVVHRSPTSQDGPIGVGDTVEALDRGNIGTVAAINDDGTIAVHFNNKSTGAHAEVNFDSDELAVLERSNRESEVAAFPEPEPIGVGDQGQEVDALPEPEPIGVGDKVQALDRGNIGTVAAINDDGTIAVHFNNKSTGAHAEVNFDSDELAVLTRFDPKDEPRVKMGDRIDGPDGAGQVIDTNGNNVILKLDDGKEISYSTSQLDGFVADSTDNVEKTALADSARPTGGIRPSGRPDPQRLANHQRQTGPDQASAKATPPPKPLRPSNWNAGRQSPG